IVVSWRRLVFIDGLLSFLCRRSGSVTMLASGPQHAASTPKSPLAHALSFAAFHSPYYSKQAWAAALREKRRLQFRDILPTPANLVKEDASSFYGISR